MATSPLSANEYEPMKDEASNTRQQRRRCGRFSRLTVILASVALAIIVIAVAVGLGVGLTVGRGANNGSEPTSPTTPSTPGNNTSSGNSSIWQPAVGSTWQIALLEPLELAAGATSTTPNVDIFDIDLFTNPNSTISTLHNLGKKVICYFSAGSYEPDRPDSSQFNATSIGKALDGWPNEKWVDIRSDNIRNIMAARIQLASEKGCDAVDPDNVDGYVCHVAGFSLCLLTDHFEQNNANGLGLTMDDTISYMQFLSNKTAEYGLGLGLKNAGEVVPNVTSIVQFSVNEQCVQYKECATFAPLVAAGKPVFHIEYPSSAPSISVKIANDFCSTTGSGAGSENFSTLLKNMNLDGWVEYCDHSTANTTLNTS